MGKTKNFETRKIEAIQFLAALENDEEDKLSEIRAILNIDTPWWDEEAEKEAIAESNGQVAAGQVLSHEEVMRALLEKHGKH